jgi:hypothetical protein
MAEHIHRVYDTDARFVINPASRTIANKTEGKVVLMQYDHNSEEFTFEVPRYVEGHDMAQSTVAQVHYDNGDSKGRYDAREIKVCEDDESKVTFTWLISQNATCNAGNLSFLVKFRCYEGDEIVYEWNTAPFDGFTVKEGKNYDEEIVVQNADAIERLRNDLEGQVESEVDSTFEERLKTEVWTMTLMDGSTVEKLVFVP